MAGMPRCAVFFQSGAQYQALRDAFPELLEGAALIGLSSHLSPRLAAERDGYLFFPYTDFLDGAEFAAAAQEAQELSRTWPVMPIGSLPDADLLEAVRLEVLQSLHEILVAQRVISRALEALRPEKVAAAPGLDAKLAAVLEYEAEQRGISVVVVGPNCTPASVAGRPAGGAGAPRRRDLRTRAGRMLHSVQQEAHNLWSLAGLRLRRLSHRRPLVLAFGTGVDSVNQQRLLPAIEADGRVRALLLRAGETDATMLNRPGSAEFPVLHFVPWNAMLRARRYTAACRRLWEAYRVGQAAYRGAHAFIFANPRLSPFFTQLYLHLLPHALATRQDACAWLRRLQPDLVLTSGDVSFPVRTLILEAGSRGIPTLGLIHSGLNNMYYRDFRSSRMAVWGEVHVRDFERVLGKARASLVPIGNPQYDTFGLQVREPAAAAHRTPRVVVLTAVAQWQMLYYNQQQHLRVWRELERLPEYGIHVVIKPHPRFDDYGFYAGLPHALADWREDRPGISVARNAFLEEVVPGCDVAVVPDLPTTGAVEAMLLAKPVIFFMCGFEEAGCCTSIAPGCLTVREVERVIPALQEVLGSRERQQELVQQGQAYLDDLLGPRDRQATRRFVDVVVGMATGQTPAESKTAGNGAP